MAESAIMEEGKAALSIQVAEPIKNSEGLNSYMSYKVHTETTLDWFEDKQFSAIRRYSDFAWLRETLQWLLPGCIIPPLPEKAVMNRFAPEFVESRRRALQRFLIRCGEHPLISQNDTFRMFLAAGGDELAKAKGDISTQKKEGGVGGSARWLSGMVNMSSLSSKASEKSDDDEKIDEISTYVQNLEAQMQNVAKHTNALVKRGRELSQGLFDFGLAFTLLGQHETEALNSALAQMGHTSDQLSLIAAEQVEKEQLRFEEPITDYIQMLGAVKEAIASRQQTRKNYFLALGDREAKDALLEKLQAAPTKNEAKIESTQEALSQAKTREQEMENTLMEVTERTLEEVNRFKTMKAEDMRKVVLDYVELQIEYNKRMENQWAALIPEIEKIQSQHQAAESVLTTNPPLPPGNSAEPPLAPEPAEESGDFVGV